MPVPKEFFVTVQYDQEDLDYIAEQNGLSNQELTDTKLAEFLAEDFTDFIGSPVLVTAVTNVIAEAKNSLENLTPPAENC